MNYPHFPADCQSLLCQYLTPEIFDQLKDKETPYGFTLADVIRSGVENPDSSIGVYAGDRESYTLFAPLFDPIIQAYHGFLPRDQHRSHLEATALPDITLDPEGEYVLSTRIRVGRNLADFPLGAGLNREQREQVERKIITALGALEGDLAGAYYPLYDMDASVQSALIADHFLFREGDRFLEAAGLNRDWPQGRGIFHNHEKRFLVWVNEEDQLRIISMQEGGNVQEVFDRLIRALAQLEQLLSFAWSEHLGYISSCPTNLGTAMRASVHIRLPQLAQHPNRLEEIVNYYHLQVRGKDGEHSTTHDPIFDISNRRRLGITEVEAVGEMMRGVDALIREERALGSRLKKGFLSKKH